MDALLVVEELHGNSESESGSCLLARLDRRPGRRRFGNDWRDEVLERRERFLLVSGSCTGSDWTSKK